MKPLSSADIPWEGSTTIPRFHFRYRHLTMAAIGKDYHVGVAIEELPPGMQSAPAHYHIHEEEHVYLLEGVLTVRIGTDTHEMRAGDYVCFPAGQRAGHYLINNSSAVCRYVILGERNPNEVCVYPDSNKVLVRALGRRAMFDIAARRKYWDGENAGFPEGVLPPPDPDESAPIVPVGDSELKPLPPISSANLSWEETSVGTRFGGRSKHLTFAAVGKPDYHVGVLIESPAPGKCLSLRHYHMLEEEQALILEGQVTLLLGDERYEMKAGDYVCFPAGQKVGHSFMNSGTGPCSYLMIGERNPNDIRAYPDSNKMDLTSSPA